MQNDDLRAQLIRQFPAEVVEVNDGRNDPYYACPTCGRAVAAGTEKCTCNQALSWKNIQREEAVIGDRKNAVIEFEVAPDFAAGDCRRCPLSYIGKSGAANVYECPLNMRGNCRIKLS